MSRYNKSGCFYRSLAKPTLTNSASIPKFQTELKSGNSRLAN